ncbi:DNA-binding transcriptional regulator FruR [Canicola haemoglobinophilus]|uniref:Sucrose operon repressor n=1 Tax=Canicola haemoglobinophilus TaxID=733 RepID=A0A1V4AZY2_9PAST|nr:DNA-binding transcriptional regulator FruR [Canicola haemoglobinophilus]STO60240.1 sucrose operon repressor [Canicola haemoglobinophilus]
MKLDEIAKLAGVSRTTVSYVINGKAKKYRVSDRTIEKVKSVIKQYDFKPNIMAAGLRAGKTYSIGLIIPDLENTSELCKIANLLESKFRERGYQLLITCTNDNQDIELQCAKHLIQRQVDALLVSSALPADTVFYNEYAQIPILGFDRYLNGKHVTNVLGDDENDAQCLADNLFKKQSYSKVLFLSALVSLPVSQARERGFHKAFSSHNNIAVDYLYVAQFNKAVAKSAVEKWLENNEVPEAIFCTSLTLLQGFFQALLDKLGEIPKSLVIATFGHHEMLEILSNPVVCMVQDYQKIVQTLINLSLNELEDRQLGSDTNSIQRKVVYHHYD